MKDTNFDFDINQALADLKAGKPLTGQDGLLTPLIKQLTEAALKAEQEQHLVAEKGQTVKMASLKRPSKQVQVPLNWTHQETVLALLSHN